MLRLLLLSTFLLLGICLKAQPLDSAALSRAPYYSLKEALLAPNPLDVRKIQLEVSSDSLPSALLRFSNLQEIKAHYKGIRYLPQDIGRLKHLEVLSFSGNQIEALPSSLAQLDRLHTLYISYNQLYSGAKHIYLPHELGNMKRLTSLTLIDCGLEEVPSFVEALPSLKKLNLYSNSIARLPNWMGNLSSLEEVNLGANRLSFHATENIGALSKMPKLKWLDLTNNAFASLPESLGEMQSLESLFLYNNALSTLPPALGNLKRLKVLVLGEARGAGNPLKSLPEELGGLQSLEKLDASCGELEALPESVGALERLKMLSLYKNKLASLPESLGKLPQLEMLEVGENRLTHVPDALLLLPSLKKFGRNSNPFSKQEAQRMMWLLGKTLPPTEIDSIKALAASIDSVHYQFFDAAIATAQDYAYTLGERRICFNPLNGKPVSCQSISENQVAELQQLAYWIGMVRYRRGYIALNDCMGGTTEKITVYAGNKRSELVLSSCDNLAYGEEIDYFLSKLKEYGPQASSEWEEKDAPQDRAEELEESQDEEELTAPAFTKADTALVKEMSLRIDSLHYMSAQSSWEGDARFSVGKKFMMVYAEGMKPVKHHLKPEQTEYLRTLAAWLVLMRQKGYACEFIYAEAPQGKLKVFYEKSSYPIGYTTDFEMDCQVWKTMQDAMLFWMNEEAQRLFEEVTGEKP